MEKTGFGESCTISHHSTNELLRTGEEPRRLMRVQLTNVPPSNQRTGGFTGPDAGTDIKDGNSREIELQNQTKIDNIKTTINKEK